MDRPAGQIFEQMQDVLERTGDEEVLLGQPQLLADRRLIVGIEHFGDR